MSQSIANLIRFIHYSVIAFLVFVPFFGGNLLLTLHFLSVPILFFHWATNQNICSLTLFEALFTNTPMDDTFMASILYPFFELDDNVLCGILILLWFITFYKLYQNNFALLRTFYRIARNYVFGQ